MHAEGRSPYVRGGRPATRWEGHADTLKVLDLDNSFGPLDPDLGRDVAIHQHDQSCTICTWTHDLFEKMGVEEVEQAQRIRQLTVERVRLMQQHL